MDSTLIYVGFSVQHIMSHSVFIVSDVTDSLRLDTEIVFLVNGSLQYVILMFSSQEEEKRKLLLL